MHISYYDDTDDFIKKYICLFVYSFGIRMLIIVGVNVAFEKLRLDLN